MILNGIKNWKHLNAGQKKTVVLAVSVPTVAFAAAAAWWLWPNRYDQLEKWHDDYPSFCYTEDLNDDQGLLNSATARNRIYGTHDYLNASFPHGVLEARELSEDLQRWAYCYDPRETGADIDTWLLTRVVVIDGSYNDSQYAVDLLAERIDSFWNSTVQDRVDRLIVNDAIFYSRFQRGIYATYMVDQLHRVYRSEFGDNVFNTPHWQNLEAHNFFGIAASSYRESMTLDGADNFVFTQRTSSRVLRDTLTAFMIDGDTLNEGDLTFMRSYYSRLKSEVSYQVCTGAGESRTCTTYWRDVAPPNYVHSASLEPESLVRLAQLAFDVGDEDAFFDEAFAENMLNDPRINMIHSQEADYQLARIHARIRQWNTGAHFRGDVVDQRYLFDTQGFEAVNIEASENQLALR